jgi:hypothetical protein
MLLPRSNVPAPRPSPPPVHRASPIRTVLPRPDRTRTIGLSTPVPTLLTTTTSRCAWIRPVRIRPIRPSTSPKSWNVSNCANENRDLGNRAVPSPMTNSMRSPFSGASRSGGGGTDAATRGGQPSIQGHAGRISPIFSDTRLQSAARRRRCRSATAAIVSARREVPEWPTALVTSKAPTAAVEIPVPAISAGRYRPARSEYPRSGARRLVRSAATAWRSIQGVKSVGPDSLRRRHALGTASHSDLNVERMDTQGSSDHYTHAGAMPNVLLFATSGASTHPLAPVTDRLSPNHSGAAPLE